MSTDAPVSDGQNCTTAEKSPRGRRRSPRPVPPSKYAAPAAVFCLPRGRKGNNPLIELVPCKKPLASVFLDPVSRETVAEVVGDWRNRQELLAVGQSPARSLALIGLPGWGKTALAAAIAAELDLPCYRLVHGEVLTSYLGETAGNLDEIAEKVRTQQLVLLVDEFDSLGQARSLSVGKGADVGEMRRICNALLQMLDKLGDGVLVVVATNMAEVIDPAVWRRLDHVLRLGPVKQDTIYYYDCHWQLTCDVFRSCLCASWEDLHGPCGGDLEEDLRSLCASPADAERLARGANLWAWRTSRKQRNAEAFREYWATLVNRMRTRRQLIGEQA